MFTLFEKASRVNKEEWASITNHETTFLEIDFLKVLESIENTNLLSRYVVVYQNQIPCGVIYFQIVDFKAEVFGSILADKVETIKSAKVHLFEKYIDVHKNGTILRLFTCGNNLVSGDYGFKFSNTLSQECQLELVLKITEVIAKEEKLSRTISAILIKDFEQPLQPNDLIKKEKYIQFFVEPNLVVDLPENITGIEEYIHLFSKKYRNRAKSIFKKGSAITQQLLNLSDIERLEEDIYTLYDNIYQRAKFKLIKLPKHYFSDVKKLYPEHFVMKGFFLEGKLVAFNSCFTLHNNVLEAHYIGLDYRLNTQYELYQNILYCMISIAIEHKKQKVNLGRTAAEIKTTVGAKPQDLTCYLKPQNTLSKIIQKPFVNFLKPGEWVARNPFKEE
ncbi:MAG: hypothetical protein SFY56_03020 [Bacteroidota bacterium]|nr:hypothetical protein [Bacteroidota bacterium]